MAFITRWSWVFAFLGAFFAAIAAVLYTLTGELGTPGTYLLIAAGSFFLAWGVFDKDTVTEGLSSKQFRHGGGSLLATALVVLLGIGSYALARRHDARWDWSRDQRFSLSERSGQILGSLDREVRILAFFRADTPDELRFRTLMEGYEQASPFIKVQFVDPDAFPRMAAENAVTSGFGTVILQAGDDRQRLEADFSETAVADALTRVLAGDDHRICWAGGHGEIDPDDDQTGGGMGIAVLKLEDRNYTVTTSVVLLDGIDAACDAVVVAAPQGDWEAPEREALAEYIAGGGRALLLIEPEAAPELAADVERYGVRLGNDLVIDPSVRARAIDIEDPAFLIVTSDGMANHPVTRSLRAPVLVGASRSVKAVSGTPGFALHELLIASPESWGETNLAADPYTEPGAWQPDEGSELTGSVPLAVASTITDPLVIGTTAADDIDGLQPGGRVLVFGTADFARNALVTRAANQALFESALGWLVEDEASLAPPPESEGDELYLSLMRYALALLLSVVIIPGLAVFAAIVAAVRRRFQ